MSQMPGDIGPSAIGTFPLPPLRRTFMQLIVDRNPFYLLSAVLMFAGCRMIISALDVAAGDTGKLLLLIGTLNVYEFLLIALALFLIVKRGLRRDGWILLSIEALFLVDLTFLNGEVFTANLKLGGIVNLICFALALVKVALVIRILRLRVPWPALAFIAVQLAALFGLSGLFKEVSHNGSLSALQLYAAWWAVGLLPVAAALVLGNARSAGRTHPVAALPAHSPFTLHPSPFSAAPAHPMAALPGRLYMLLPFIALLAHLAGENRVYWVHFHAANLAPVLLGVAVGLGGLASRRRFSVARVQVLLVGLAVLISAPFHGDLAFRMHGIWCSPLRLALAGGAAALLYSYVLHRRPILPLLAAAFAAAAALGMSVDQMLNRSLALERWLMDGAGRLIPTTPMQWGVVAVAASFVMLAMGAMMSLRKREGVG